jgi:hypothetical protein
LKNYNSLWKALELLIAEFRQKSGTIPNEIIEDLKSAKTLISILNADPSQIEIITDLESHLGKMEATLLYLAETKFGKEYADEYSKRLIDTKMRSVDQENVSSSRFIIGIPRGAHMIRFKLDDTIGRKDVEELVQNLKLSYKWQDKDIVIIYGAEEKIKTFIQKVANKTGKTKKK